MMLPVAHLLWSAGFGVVAALLAGEGWGVAFAVVCVALGAFHLGRVLAGGYFRLMAMGWWVPPIAVLMIFVAG